MRTVVAFIVTLFGVSLGLGWLLPPTATTLSGFLARLLPLVWMPTVLALIFLLATEGTAATRRTLRSLLRFNAGTGGWYALALLVPPGVSLFAVYLAGKNGEATPWVSQSALPIAIGLQVITGAVGEELGWRGYLLSRLKPHMGVPAATALMGTLWATWHVPAFFTPGMPHQSFPLVWTLLFIVPFGIFMGTLFYRAGQSILVTVVAHLSLNITTALGGVMLSSTVFWATMAVCFGIAAACLLMAEVSRPREAPASPST